MKSLLLIFLLPANFLGNYKYEWRTITSDHDELFSVSCNESGPDAIFIIINIDVNNLYK